MPLYQCWSCSNTWPILEASRTKIHLALGSSHDSLWHTQACLLGNFKNRHCVGFFVQLLLESWVVLNCADEDFQLLLWHDRTPIGSPMGYVYLIAHERWDSRPRRFFRNPEAGKAWDSVRITVTHQIESWALNLMLKIWTSLSASILQTLQTVGTSCQGCEEQSC